LYNCAYKRTYKICAKFYRGFSGTPRRCGRPVNGEAPGR
jgi:hypothetical protein